MTESVAKYQQYDEYKESGVEWLDKVPSHWLESSLKYYLKSIVAGGTPESSNDSYWALSGEGIPWVSIADMSRSFEVLRTNKDVSEKGKVIKNLKILPKETILYSIFASLGKVAIAKVPLVTNQAILGLEPSANLHNSYLVYWLKYLEPYLSLYSTSNTQDNLNTEKVGNLPVLITDLYEQIKIANFLDYQTAQIDTLIDKQQTLIQLLKEKRQAVISHAVTKGLNPNTPMKDSGVEWLGEVPEHWDFGALKYWADIIDCKHITAEFVEDGYPLASIGEVKGWTVNLSTSKSTTKRFYLELIGNGRKPIYGDILYSRNATVGEAALVTKNMPNFAMGQDICLIRSDNKILPEYVLYVLNSGVIKNQLDLAMVGSTFKRINVDNIRNFDIAFPCSSEQQGIIEWLKVITTKYDDLTFNAEQAIQFMQERRTALISAAVTGKIDVRDWEEAQ